MHLANIEKRHSQPWEIVPLDDWSHRLTSVCGQFRPSACEGARQVKGTVGLTDAAGVEIVQVANDLDRVERDSDDIRRDYGEHLFLVMQLEGSFGVEQFGRQTVISPGDCILVDSSSPSRFFFRGAFSNHLSVHLPRQLLYADKSMPVAVARRLGAEDPMSTMLRALVDKLLAIDSQNPRAPHLRDLLFNATRQAFALEGETLAPAHSDSAGGRLEILQVLIDRHLTSDSLTPKWLARRLGVSLRTLQEDFSELGTTATSLIRLRRLNLARERLAHTRGSANAPTIAEIAYNSGFNDISYFNRCFKKAFNCSPKDVLNP